MDDDADCVEHVWGLAEVSLGVGTGALTKRCLRCAAVAYEDLTPEPGRPSL